MVLGGGSTADVLVLKSILLVDRREHGELRLLRGTYATQDIVGTTYTDENTKTTQSSSRRSCVCCQPCREVLDCLSMVQLSRQV